MSEQIVINNQNKQNQKENQQFQNQGECGTIRVQKQQSGGRSKSPDGQASIRSSSPGEKAFQNIKEKFSNFDVRKVYKFERLIGGGHFGTVRLAHRLSDPTIKYAVKSILRQNIKKDVKLLEEELAILQQVDHPNIIKFHESYVDVRYIHIIMELAEGGELFDKIVQSQRFSERKAADTIKKMLSAIKHLHEHQICHRDLKPENFLFSDDTPDAEIKLIDFGLSKRFGTQKLTDAEREKVKLRTIVGTPYYVAPEVLRGSYDNSCDIWSLGIILYIFLCGYPPFEGDNSKEIFKNVLKQKLLFDPVDWKDISEEAKDLIIRMLDKDPKTRITAHQCLEHQWMKIQKFNTPNSVKEIIVKKLRDFRAPKQIQLETLKFLVNNITSNVDIDFKSIRDAFRAIDTSNTGIISLDQIKKGFKFDNQITHINTDFIEQIFARLDFNNTGTINYSEFLAVTIDKKQALTKQNIQFAFHYFDTDNEGYITKEDLREVYTRQGLQLSDIELNQIISQAKEINVESGEETKGQDSQSANSGSQNSKVNKSECISFSEFKRLMRDF